MAENVRGNLKFPVLHDKLQKNLLFPGHDRPIAEKLPLRLIAGGIFRRVGEQNLLGGRRLQDPVCKIEVPLVVAAMVGEL